MRGVPTRTVAAILVALAAFLPACNTETTPEPPPTQKLSLYALEYVLLDAYPAFFWCDPDFYPIAEDGGEERNSIEQFRTIRANSAEFIAILQRLMLPLRPDYTDEEKLSIYREHKKLTSVIWMSPIGVGYAFWLRTSDDQGRCIEGSISFDGTIEESKREACSLECPICLTRGTLVDTPAGPRPVQEIAIGERVWTQDERGSRVVAPVIENSATPVARDFEVVEVTLADGRTVTASAGHPTADGRRLGDCRAGEMLDGSPVAAVERVRYNGGYTYDLLPAGPTGLYWANRVLLKSTLVPGMRPEAHPRAASGFGTTSARP